VHPGTTTDEKEGPMTQTIFPTLRYRDADRAIEWLGRAFGFTEQAVYRNGEGIVEHAQLELRGSLIMLGQLRPDEATGGSRPEPPVSTRGIYVVVEDADAHHARAAAAGAEILRPLTDQDYGSREYQARDCEGNTWSFGTYDPLAPS
jgi:uncharacterized glyoxalase superfamily protein PhnB